MTNMFCSQAVWLFLGVLIKSHFSECRFGCTILPGLKNLTKYPSLDMVLNCSFRGGIVDAVNWTRNGQPIKEANILLDPQVNKKWSAVIIAEVTRNQNLGEFKCEATIGRELFSCSASPSKPKLQRFERVKIVESGQSPEMTCRASGWPTPRVSWWRRGSQLRDGDYHYSYILQYSEDYILTMGIIYIEGYHHGTYTCRADNFFGTSVQDINIMVKRNDMIENEYERQFPSVALEGTNTTLECICKVDECKEDTANVYWKSKGHYVNQSARFRLSKRVLANSVTELLMTILNVSKIDAGERLCGINTSLGFEERKRKLRVLEKGRFPRVLSSSKDVSANLQSTVWLKCKTIYPNVLKEPETFWMFNNTLIPKHSQHYKQKDYGPAPGPHLTKILPFELGISNVSTRDFGSYFCGARFKIGEATTNISLSLKRDKNRANTDYAKPGGPKNSPLVAISSITAGGIIMGFVVAFIAYRLCRNKRNADEPFFETKVNGRQFRYDVFVTFSSQDLNWVRKELIPLVEKHKLNYCIHDRDFEIGKPVVDNMAESVYTSRKVLAVMSHNYMSSKFCRGELEMALYRSTEMGDSSVIVMRIDGVDRSKLPKALRNRTFLDYHDFAERKNWEERLIKHLRPPPIEKCLVDNTGKLYAKLQNTDV